MNLRDYEQFVIDIASERTLRDLESMLNTAALGLAGEAGEFADEVKKCLFHGHTFDSARAKKELGDILWYCTLATQALGCTLDDIIEGNVSKLRQRYPEGFSTERSINRD